MGNNSILKAVSKGWREVTAISNAKTECKTSKHMKNQGGMTPLKDHGI